MPEPDDELVDDELEGDLMELVLKYGWWPIHESLYGNTLWGIKETQSEQEQARRGMKAELDVR